MMPILGGDLPMCSIMSTIDIMRFVGGGKACSPFLLQLFFSINNMPAVMCYTSSHGHEVLP